MFTVKLATIQSSGSGIYFEKNGAIVYTYTPSEMLLDSSGVAVSGSVVAVTKGVADLTLTITTFDQTNNGLWTCRVTGATASSINAVSDSAEFKSTSLNCPSKLLFLRDCFSFFPVTPSVQRRQGI